MLDVRIKAAGGIPKLHVLIGQAQQYIVDVTLTLPIEPVFTTDPIPVDQLTGRHEVDLRPPDRLDERMLHLSSKVNTGVGSEFSVTAWIAQDGAEIPQSRQVSAGLSNRNVASVNFSWWLEAV